MLNSLKNKVKKRQLEPKINGIPVGQLLPMLPPIRSDGWVMTPFKPVLMMRYDETPNAGLIMFSSYTS